MIRPGRSGLIATLPLFGLAGVINTLTSLAVITTLSLGLKVEPHIANLAGYAVGLMISFGLNRRFVFRHQQTARVTGPKFLLAALICIGLNQMVLTLGLEVLGHSGLMQTLAQLSGMAAYTIAMFAACRLWVFRQPNAA
jgi:putative flippase GtrA